MRTIYKYKISITGGEQLFSLHNGHRVIHIGEQNGELWMWVDQRTDHSRVDFNLRAIQTGHAVGDKANGHLGTVVMSDGYVWHIYETF